MIFTADLLKSLPELVNNEMNPVTYLSIDPGKANGCGLYDSRHHVVFLFTIPEELMVDFLGMFKHIKICIIENFILFPNKRTEANYSDMQTSRVIGRVETWCQLNKIELIKQGPNVKKTGYKWLGIPSPSKSNPANHEMDAHCHFTYWAVKAGKIKASDLLRSFPSDGTYLLQK